MGFFNEVSWGTLVVDWVSIVIVRTAKRCVVTVRAPKRPPPSTAVAVPIGRRRAWLLPPEAVRSVVRPRGETGAQSPFSGNIALRNRPWRRIANRLSSISTPC